MINMIGTCHTKHVSALDFNFSATCYDDRNLSALFRANNKGNVSLK